VRSGWYQSDDAETDDLGRQVGRVVSVSTPLPICTRMTSISARLANG